MTWRSEPRFCISQKCPVGHWSHLFSGHTGSVHLGGWSIQTLPLNSFSFVSFRRLGNQRQACRPRSRLWTWWGLCRAEWILEGEALQGWEILGAKRRWAERRETLFLVQDKPHRPHASPHCCLRAPLGVGRVCVSTYLLSFTHSRP